MQYLLAHDLGTSGDKATLFTTDGQLVRSAVEAYPCDYSHGNWAEQNPADWYGAVCRATRALAADVNPAEILGVSFSGHMMGAVLLDGRGDLLRPAIIWADQRATAEQEILSRRVGDDRFYAITGNRNNPTNSITKIMWSMAHDGCGDRLAAALNCKDYIIYRLTGNLGTDYSDASGTGAFDLNTFAWSQEILEAAGVPASVMPEVHASTELAGRVTAGAAKETGLLEGTPVFHGCGDGTAASVGTGVFRVGQAYCSLGSSAWISSVGSFSSASWSSLSAPQAARVSIMVSASSRASNFLFISNFLSSFGAVSPFLINWTAGAPEKFPVCQTFTDFFSGGSIPHLQRKDG